MNQYLSFFVGDEAYGLGLLEAREIIPYGDVTSVPSMPRSVRGIIHLRGGVVPLIDLAVVFGQPERPVTRRTCVVVVAGAHVDAAIDLVGLVVDGVDQVLDLHADEVDPTVAFGTSARPRLIQATARAGDRFVLLLDLPRVLAQVDLDELDDLELPTDSTDPQEATP